MARGDWDRITINTSPEIGQAFRILAKKERRSVSAHMGVLIEADLRRASMWTPELASSLEQLLAGTPTDNIEHLPGAAEKAPGYLGVGKPKLKHHRK